MQNIKTASIFFIQLLVAAQTFSQTTNFQFQHLNSAQGLSQNTVNAVTQDKFGFIWIGTNIGLNRFDGKNIINFFYHEKDSTSIPSDKIICLFSDSNGKLWIGTEGGLCSYNFNTNTFKNIRLKGAPACNYISSLIEDRKNNLWVGTKGGLFLLNPLTDKFILYRSDTSAVQPYYANRITSLTIDENNFIWMTTLKGVKRFDPIKKEFKTYLHDGNNSNSISNNFTEGILSDLHGKIWVGTIGNGVDIIYSKNDWVVHFPNCYSNSSVIGNYFKSIFTDSERDIWFASSDGGLSFINAENNFKNILHDPNESHSISDNEINCLFQDKSGMLWVGTGKSGVERFSIQPKNFTTYFKESSWPGVTGEINVNDLCKDSSGNIWLATNKGLIKTNFEKQNFEIINNQFLNSISAHEYFIYSVLCNAKNNILIGAEPGAYQYNQTEKKLTVFSYQPTHDDESIHDIPFNASDHSFIVGNTIFKIISFNDDSVLFLTSMGITVYSISKNEFANRYNNEVLNKLPHNGYYTNGIVDDEKNIWVAGSNRLLKLNSDFTIDTIFSHDWKNQNSIPSNAVHDFIEDEKGNIWFATDNGIAKIEKRTKKITRWNKDNGLLSDYCNALIEDDDENIWVSSLKGISELKVNGEIKNYPLNENSFVNEFNNHSKLKISDQLLAFGGTKGFTVFNPQSFNQNNFLPPVQLTSFKVNNVDYFLSDSTSEINLNYNQNSFSFEMAALSFDHSDENKFAYKLEGYDGDWIYCNTRNFGSYTNLQAGDYVLHIKASNCDGVWNEKGLQLNIKVIPPFWKTMWFKILSVLLIASALFSFYKIRTRSIRKTEKKKTETERKIASMQMTALRSQMNPHFIFNSLNSIQDFIANYEREDALKYLSKFSKLIRSILNQSQNNNTTVTDELEMLKLYVELESLRFNHKFDCTFIIDEKINCDETQIPSMIIQPFIENSILHGFIGKDEDCHIKISMIKTDEKLNCVIEDNGIGRKKATEIKQNKSYQHPGFGIKLTADRIDTMNKASGEKINLRIEDLFDQNGNATGTRVQLEFTIS